MQRSHRQTVTFLQRRMAEVGIRPDARHGQNFLVDLNLLDVIVREADLQPNDVVLEVGTGMGSLTTLMAPKAGAVVTVELDANLHQLAAEELVEFTNVTMLRQDVLRNKNNIHDNVLQAVADKLAEIPDSRFKLAANLPYSIATPLISNLLHPPLVPSSMTVTIQKELADRITAVPSTKDYSALSIWVQSLCDATTLRVLPPGVFWPRPKVHSAIIQIVPREDKRARIVDLAYFHRFVRALFFHRRKFLRSVLVSATKGERTKSDIDDVLSAMGFGPDVRAEQLSVEQIMELAERVRTVGQASPDLLR
ncbi:MAG: 16S rRNA (adenine(1518)-N(6)/adenine(1519)-N(6))-dimethyltransferase RsmA [Pirellulaceae bacterium]|nr:ribosomal RNA small subunit methyltransferase A [Planctomycetales bacterium]